MNQGSWPGLAPGLAPDHHLPKQVGPQQPDFIPLLRDHRDKQFLAIPSVFTLCPFAQVTVLLLALLLALRLLPSCLVLVLLLHQVHVVVILLIVLYHNHLIHDELRHVFSHQQVHDST